MKEQLQTFTEEEFDADEEDTLDGRYLIFFIEDRNYGIEIKHITEIIGLQAITPVPDMPAFIKGVINLRGKIIPLIDMRSRFNISEAEYSNKTCTIILAIQNRLIGLIVDTVREVIKIREEQLEEAPRFGETGGNRFVKALAKVDGDVKVLLDIEKLLQEEDDKKIKSILQES